jgi:hypothetical protein
MIVDDAIIFHLNEINEIENISILKIQKLFKRLYLISYSEMNPKRYFNEYSNKLILNIYLHIYILDSEYSKL